MRSQLFDTQSLELPRLKPGEKADVGFARRYPLRILIAEDNYTNRRLLLLFLKGLGYEARATENGQECLDAILGNSFDILLTDIDMPEMNGIDCAARIREAGITLPIVAVAASQPELTAEECFAAGMNGYMKKPINVTELKRVLKEISLRKWVHEANVVTAEPLAEAA